MSKKLANKLISIVKTITGYTKTRHDIKQKKTYAANSVCGLKSERTTTYLDQGIK